MSVSARDQGPDLKRSSRHTFPARGAVMKIFGETTPMNKFTRDKVDPLAPAWLCGIAALTLAAPMALSQNAAQSVSSNLVLEEVMVTATKRTEKLQDVPVAVSALTSEDISARGFSQYADYLNTVPGVYFEEDRKSVV